MVKVRQGNALIVAGLAGLSVSVLWWFIFYSRAAHLVGANPADLQYIRRCLIEITGPCRMIQGVASATGMIAYEPLMLWISIGLLAVGSGLVAIQSPQAFDSQDFASGLMFMVFGIGALILGVDYSMGTIQRPGTGVLPAILSGLLMLSGAALFMKGLLSNDEGTGHWAWRPFVTTTLAVVIFGLLVDDLGLIVTMLLCMTICALGTSETRWIEFLMFCGIMVALAYGLFIWALGMPIPTWPARVPTWLPKLSS